MTWHYNLAHKTVNGEKLFGIVEVYLDENNILIGHTENFVDANCVEEAKDVVWTLKAMLHDVETYPVIDLDDVKYGKASHDVE